MYKCIGLTKNKVNCFKELNDYRYDFNNLNEDFFKIYDDASLIEKIILRKKVKLIFLKDKCIGYIWNTKRGKENYINALSVDSEHKCDISIYEKLINSIKYDTAINYCCENNGENYNILKTIGFIKKEGTIQLKLDLKDKTFPFNTIPYICIEKLCLNRDEKIRCFIQNEIFKSNTRIPLTVEDIYYDEKQDYYYENGSIFMKIGENYIGYGQVIMENQIPFIVNFGIMPGYRGKGYSKILLFHILNVLKEKNFDFVMIRVNSFNNVALNLYESVGFTLFKEIYDFQIKK
ncbi:GNAT family N-acetyltransferase [Clostridium niameyense]|uniref:GNAT family N-acetyltransferase n=1 Tax=Clostridium niameyense TaxID=1622073 RepID=A0A6M0R969_9CLOT|nr:GNAT family N-acetyltransferase [Clostridium niameyense]NEZ46190.1 GNAT family N-acetyltransferase [Clostridium niameyense]